MYRAKDFQAIMMDLDGTLLDTLQDLADSMNGTLRSFGFPVHQLEKYKYFVGDGMTNLVIRSLPDSAKNRRFWPDIALCLEVMRKNYGAQLECENPGPTPQSHSFLTPWPPAASKWLFFPISLKTLRRKSVEKVCAGLAFSSAVVGERPLIPRKPDPSSALEIANRCLGIEPAAGFLYSFGDTSTDMKTANAAGMYAVRCALGISSAPKNSSKAAPQRLIAKPCRTACNCCARRHG